MLLQKIWQQLKKNIGWTNCQLHPEMAKSLDLLAKHLEIPQEEVIKRALTLYKF